MKYGAPLSMKRWHLAANIFPVTKLFTKKTHRSTPGFRLRNLMWMKIWLALCMRNWWNERERLGFYNTRWPILRGKGEPQTAKVERQMEKRPRTNRPTCRLSWAIQKFPATPADTT